MAFPSELPFSLIFAAGFNTDEDSFVYVDDTFRGTGEPDYADGVRVPAGGVSGGALQVLLGNVDDDDINGMSGGWEREFTLTEPTFVILRFSYNLTQSADYEADEFSEVLVALDGALQGQNGNDFIDRITGNGNGGGEQSTGFVQVELNLGLLEAGDHTITLGGFNNKKTFNDEETQILFDNVELEGAALPADTEVLINETFNDDTGGFVFQDDIFRGTNEPDYADGQRVETGGEQDGVLQVELGGEDDADITNMSGGWVRTFELTETASVKLCFRFNMTQASDYEADEFSEVLVSLNNVLQGTNGDDFIAQIFGDGNGGPAQTTGWQEVELDLGILGPGTHTLALGGFNNKKTLANESTEILFDDVLLVQSGADPVKLFNAADEFVGGFNTLEDAIAASSADFRIEIVETTLATGPAQIVIPHNLTIEGAGQDLTVLQASANTVNSGDDKGWFLVPDGVEFNLSGLTLDGNGFEIFQGIRTRGSGDIDDVKFLNITTQDVGGGQPYSGLGVVVFGPASDVDITNSTFENIGRVGALYFGPGVTGTFQGNSYTGKGAGDHLDYAADINAGANVQVIDNTVTNNRGVASSDGSVSAGFLVSTQAGAGTNVTFEGNTLENNSSGVFIGFNQNEASTVTFDTGNTFTNNETGVQVRGNPTVNTPENITGDSADFNYIGGNAANDFSGAALDDNLNGGENADSLAGGDGDDRYKVDDVGDTVTEQPNEGTDLVRSEISYTLPANVENLTLLNVPGPSLSSYSTDFEGLTTDVSIDGQDGWDVDGPPTFDESVEDDGGNTVWRVSNAVTSGAFNNQPFAPRPVGSVNDPANDPVNGDPDSFAGESSTGASSNRFFAQFDFKSATGAAQDGLSITASPSNGSTGRQGFFRIEDNGNGLEIVTFDVDSEANFNGPITIAEGLSYTDFHQIGIEIIFKDGPENDVVNYFLDGELIHTGPSWESYYPVFEAALHPSGVPVQSLIFRVSGDAEPTVQGEGLFIDNLSYDIGPVAPLNGTGNELDNTITGNDGDNILSGLAGNDVLLGEAGSDRLIGGENDDELDGGAGSDIAVFSGNVAEYGVELLPDGSLRVLHDVPNGDGVDIVRNVEALEFNDGVLPVGPVLVFDGSVFQGGFQTIQEGVDNAADGFTVLVAPGTYNENVEIGVSITLLSVGGRENTIIQGSAAPGGSETGTVYILDDTDNVQIGDPVNGFTIVGFDNPDAPGIETAAVNISGDQTNIRIIGNEIVAEGEAGLLTEWGATIDGLLIDNNTFSGRTLDTGQPASTVQWTKNFPWAMLFVGNAPTKSNIVVTDNIFEGETAGVTLDGEIFGNIAVTVDATGATVNGNTFATDASNFGLRTRGTNTEVSNNTFDNSGEGNTTGFTLGGEPPSGPYVGNVFIGSENGDVFYGTPGDDQTFTGNDGKDFLAGNPGDDIIDGGADIDTAVFNGAAADYDINFGTDTTPTTIIDANFDAGADGFVFQDDTFNGTSQPDYASGQQIPVGGFSGGALQVLLGNVDDADILGMSGGFEQTFNLAEEARVTLSLRFNMTQSSEYEADEFSQVLVALDGVLQGIDGNEFLAQIVGNGNGGGAQSTGFQQVELDLGILPAGNHTLTLGGFNNKKTLANEETEILFDDVLLTSTPAPTEVTVFEQDFDLGPGDFNAVPDAFRGTNEPDYVALGIVNDEMLIGLGNVDNDDILGMSGGFSREFTLDDPGEVIVTFTYNLTQSADYEADEFSQVLLALDGVLQGVGGNDFIDQVTGNGNGGGAISTGPQEITINLGELEAGNHTLTFGGFNNKKTLANEETEVTFDDIVVKQLIAPSGNTTVTDTVGDDGTDTLIDIENLFFLGEDPVQVFDADGNFVNAFTTIQGAIDDAGTLDGFKIVVGPGEYNENVTVNKELTIAGAGEVLLNGEGLGGNGITIAADNVTIDPITVTNFAANGIFVGTAVSNLVLDGIRTSDNNFDGIRVDAQVTGMTLLGVESTGNSGRGFHVQTNGDITDLVLTEVNFSSNTLQGLRVASSGQLDGVTVTDSHFDNNEYGWFVANDGGTSSVQNVTVSDTTFDRNFNAAIYAETMVGANFTNVTAINSGTGPSNNIAFDFVAFYDQTEVRDITFDGFTVQHTTGGSVFSAFRFEGFQAASAGFGDSPSPTDITIQNGTVDNVERVVLTNAGPGEFTQNNVTLVNIGDFESQQRGNEGSDTLNGDLFSNNDRDWLDGEAFFLPGGATDTLNGGGGNDVLRGGIGDDQLNGGDGLDAALYEGLGTEYSPIFDLSLSLIGITDTNAADGNEGTDTLIGIETLYFLGEEVVQVFDVTGNFVASYATIQAAVDAASTLDGFKVVIGSGTYNESVTVDKALEFVGVDSGGGLPTITPPAGSAFVLSGDLGSGNTVGFHNLKFEDAPRSGIQLGGDVTLGSLEISDSHFSANERNGVEVVNGENLGNFVLENSTFFANGQPSGSSGDGDVLLFNYEGDAILRDLLITGADRGTGPAENGIQFRGDNGPNAPEGPLGSVLFQNITIDGIYEKQPIAFFNYDDVDGLTMTNVQVLADSLGFNLALNFDGISGDVDFSAFDVTFANDPAAIQDANLADNNILIGGDGNEILNGKAGNDILVGGNGEDLIIGSLGTDTLTGGGDADTFLFGLGDGGPNLALADVITDFEDGLDLISLAGGLEFADLEISSSNGDAVIAAGAEVLAVVQNADGLLDSTDFIVA